MGRSCDYSGCSWVRFSAWEMGPCARPTADGVLELNMWLATVTYRGADKSLARPGRKQATATEGFEFHISYL